MTKTVDPRKARIRELKAAIAAAQDEIATTIATPSEGEEEKKNAKENIMIKKTLIQNMQVELKQVRDNRLSSKFFEFIPTPPNRRQARQFRRNRNARNTPAMR